MLGHSRCPRRHGWTVGTLQLFAGKDFKLLTCILRSWIWIILDLDHIGFFFWQVHDLQRILEENEKQKEIAISRKHADVTQLQDQILVLKAQIEQFDERESKSKARMQKLAGEKDGWISALLVLSTAHVAEWQLFRSHTHIRLCRSMLAHAHTRTHVGSFALPTGICIYLPICNSCIVRWYWRRQTPVCTIARVRAHAFTFKRMKFERDSSFSRVSVVFGITRIFTDDFFPCSS